MCNFKLLTNNNKVTQECFGIQTLLLTWNLHFCWNFMHLLPNTILLNKIQSLISLYLLIFVS